MISDVDKTKLINIQTRLEYVDELTIIKNRHGEHFDDCIWSNENSTCALDTCPCIFNKHRL